MNNLSDKLLRAAVNIEMNGIRDEQLDLIIDLIREAAVLSMLFEKADSVRVIGTGYGAGWGDLRFSGSTKIRVGHRLRLVQEWE